MPALECDAAFSDMVLQAARQALPENADSLGYSSSSGTKNAPLMPLLVALMDATGTVANAVADNAWDDCQPIAAQLADDLARQARRIADDLINATQCPDAAGWSLPSMTGKELV